MLTNTYENNGDHCTGFNDPSNQASVSKKDIQLQHPYCVLDTLLSVFPVIHFLRLIYSESGVGQTVRERIPNRPSAVSTELNVGLEPTNYQSHILSGVTIPVRYGFPMAAITIHHKLGGLKHIFSYCSRSQRSKTIFARLKSGVGKAVLPLEAPCPYLFQLLVAATIPCLLTTLI